MSDRKGIRFRRNIKSKLIQEGLQLGEVVYAVDTDEWGLGISPSEIEWRKHEFFFNENYIVKEENASPEGKPEGAFIFETSSGMMYHKLGGILRQFIMHPSFDYLLDHFLEKGKIPDYDDFSKIIYTDSSLPEDYYPENDKDVLSYKQSEFLLDMDDPGECYLTKFYYKDKNGLISRYNFENSSIFLKLPDQQPNMDGILWRQNIVPFISKTETVIRVTYNGETDHPVTAKKNLVSLRPPAWFEALDGENADYTFEFIEQILLDDGGYYDVYEFRSVDAEWVSFVNVGSYWEAPSIIKIEIISSKLRTLYALATNSRLEEFKVYGDTGKLEDIYFAFRSTPLKIIDYFNTSNVTSFESAFEYCYSLAEFPQLDTSNVVNFKNAWRYTSLTNFPLLDCSNGVDFENTWATINFGSSEFPLIDVSNGVIFSFTWGMGSEEAFIITHSEKDDTKYKDSLRTYFPDLDFSNGVYFNGTWSGKDWDYHELYLPNATTLDSAWEENSFYSFPMVYAPNVTTLRSTWGSCFNLTSFPEIDIPTVTNLLYTWEYCRSLTSFPVLDTSNITDFGGAWSACSGLTSFPELDTSNGSSFYATWSGCSSLTSFPQIVTSNATYFYNTWYKCSSLTSFPQIDTSKVRDFSYTWYGCRNLTSFPELDVSSGTVFNNAWYGCSSLTSFPQLDVSSGTDFSSAWDTCSSLTSFPQLDVSSGTNFSSAWRDCVNLTSFPVLNVSNGYDFTYTWYNCSKLPHCPAGNEVTIPPESITTDMCAGTCCTG